MKVLISLLLISAAVINAYPAETPDEDPVPVVPVDTEAAESVKIESESSTEEHKRVARGYGGFGGFPGGGGFGGGGGFARASASASAYGGGFGGGGYPGGFGGGGYPGGGYGGFGRRGGGYCGVCGK